MSHHIDYENMAMASLIPMRTPILEDYTGVQIVSWYGQVGTEMRKKRDHYEKSDNRVLADKITAFLRTWDNNPITGSINRETLEMYKAASLILGNDTNHDIGSFFRALTTEIDKVIAQTEQLPADGQSAEPAPRAKSFGGGGPTPSFGGEETGPPAGPEGPPPPAGEDGAGGGDAPPPPDAGGAGGPPPPPPV